VVTGSVRIPNFGNELQFLFFPWNAWHRIDSSASSLWFRRGKFWGQRKNLPHCIMILDPPYRDAGQYKFQLRFVPGVMYVCVW